MAINHWIVMYDRKGDEAIEKDVVDALNAWVGRFRKLPNVLYIKDRSIINKKRIKGPRITIRNESAAANLICIGHTKDKSTNDDGPTFGTLNDDELSPWKYVKS